MSEGAWLERLPTSECLRLLRERSVGRIAVVVEDHPLILPVNYRLAEPPGRTWIAVRTRPDNMVDRASMNVAFEIDAIDPVHEEGWSVVVRGTMHRVLPDAAAFRERFDPEPWLTEDRDRWLAIEPYSISGRLLHRAPREWAFHVEAYL